MVVRLPSQTCCEVAALTNEDSRIYQNCQIPLPETHPAARLADSHKAYIPSGRAGPRRFWDCREVGPRVKRWVR